MATHRNGIGHIKRTKPNRDFRRKHLQGAVRVRCKSLTRTDLRTATTGWLRGCLKQLREYAA